MRKQTARRGFTITELVIVIVVIAILAAVLIPTFASLIKKANLSSDEQAVREMNSALSADSVTTKPTGLKDVIDILEDVGFDALALKPHTKGFDFYWCSEHNVVLLVEEKTNAVKFPSDKKTAEAFAAHVVNGTLDAAKLFNLEDGIKHVNTEVEDAAQIKEVLVAGGDVTLTKDIVVTEVIPVKGDVTIDLNGHKLSGGETGRPLEMTDGANLTVQAGDKEVDCGQYGLVNVPATVKECTVNLDGGSYKGTSDNGAFLKVRPGAEKVNINMKNVNYVDNGTAFLLNVNEFTGEANILVEGGSYTANAGFQVPGKAKFVGVNVVTNAVAFEVYGEAEIIDCTITTKNATVGTAPSAAVAVSAGGSAKVTGCTINSTGNAYAVYTTGGTIVADNNKVLHSAGVYKIHTPFNADVASGTVGRITIDGKVVAEYVK